MKKDRKYASQKMVAQEKKYYNPYAELSSNGNPSSMSRRTTKVANKMSNNVNGAAKKRGLSRSNVSGTKKGKGVKLKAVPSNKRRTVEENKRAAKKRENLKMKTAKPKQRKNQTIRSISEGREVGATTRLQLKKSKKLTKRQRLAMKRRRQIQLVFRVIAVMAMTIGFVCGIVALVSDFTKTKVSTQIVQEGSLDTSLMLDGVVIRSEKVTYASESGMAQYVVAEGEKIKKDGTVYVLVNEQQVASTTSQIEEVEKQLYNKAENSAATANNQAEKYNLALEVKNNFAEYYNNCFDSSTNYVYALRSKLDSIVSNRTELYMQQLKDKNDSLAAQKVTLDKNLQNYQKGKVAEASGIVSFHVDGYETEDALTAVNEMTYDNYVKQKKIVTTNQLGQNSIESDSPIYKLILNNIWYIVSYVDEKDDQFVQGNTYKLYFDKLGDQAISFLLEQKQEVDGKIKLVFKSSDQIGNFLADRGVNFSIGEKAISGLKIPISAIAEHNLIEIPMGFTATEKEKLGVYRKKGEVTEFVNIEVQSTDKENEVYYVLQDVTNASIVQLNDILVNKETGETYQLVHSTVKPGVYVVNGKIANFKEIEIIDQSKEYAIVKYNNNSQLKEMDKIISNPKSIKADQLLDDMKIQND